LPPELRSARLAFAERLFRSEGPIPLVAQLDRAYRTTAGVLVLIELKTRAASRAYGSDVIELSAQRLALEARTGDVVADHAYVLTQNPDGRQTGWHLDSSVKTTPAMEAGVTDFLWGMEDIVLMAETNA